MILRYEQNPSAAVARPAYIPPHMHELAEFVEIQYAEQGVARIWYVPPYSFAPARAMNSIMIVRSYPTVGTHSALLLLS